MADYRLTDATRGTLAFEQAQRDEDAQQAIADITKEIGVDRPALVHTRSRERERTLAGRVTGPKRSRDSDTGDWQQALANYVARLEAHVDEFQGTGYTFEDDTRGESLSAVMKSVEWTLLPGQPFEVQWETTIHVGRGTFESRSVQLNTPSVNTGMAVPARVGGVDLPGLREMKVTKELEFETNALYGDDTAENTEIVVEAGVEHRIEYRGAHTGPQSQRDAADDDLEALLSQNGTTFVTRFPGYSLTGVVTAYSPERNQSYGGTSHQYSLTFVEGVEA